MTMDEREQRGDINFVKGGRAARDATRKQHTAETLYRLDRTAKICAQAAARKRELHRGIVDPALRRKERRARIKALMVEYREAVVPLLEWFDAVERERDPSVCSPLLYLLEKKAQADVRESITVAESWAQRSSHP